MKRKKRLMQMEIRPEKRWSWADTKITTRWMLFINGVEEIGYGFAERSAAVRAAKTSQRILFSRLGRPSELRIRKLDGTWSSDAFTYPRSADPKRSKG